MLPRWMDQDALIFANVLNRRYRRQSKFELRMLLKFCSDVLVFPSNLFIICSSLTQISHTYRACDKLMMKSPEFLAQPGRQLEAWLQMPPAMKTLVLWAVMALVVVVPVEGLAAPMQKVIGALEKMQATSEEEMQEEKIQFTKFDQFCSATLDAKKKAIQQTTVTLESITSEISRLDSEAEKMATEIAQHEAAIRNSQTQQSNATELRKAEEENFNATHLDLQESIVAIQKALQQLKKEKKEDYDRPQSTSSFVQSNRGLGGLERSEAVAKALALAGAFRNKPVPPKADAYEFQSGSIIEVLEDLKDQFKKQIAEVESVETKKKNSHELLLSSLDSEIKVNKKATEKKSGFKDSALGRKAEAEAKKSDVMADLEADEKYRNDLSVECKVKGDDFAERQRVRSDEIQAMKKAIDILRNPSFLQSSQTPMSPFAKASSLALLRSANRSPPIAEAMKFLQKRAEELHSQSLQNLLVRLQQVPNVAVENIVKMLKEKLEKLQTEDVDDSSRRFGVKMSFLRMVKHGKQRVMRWTKNKAQKQV